MSAHYIAMRICIYIELCIAMCICIYVELCIAMYSIYVYSYVNLCIELVCIVHLCIIKTTYIEI